MKGYNVVGYTIILAYALACMVFAPPHIGPWMGLLIGAAYFVNEAGDFAGSGSHGANGWEWSVKPEIATAVQEVVTIYRNERTARFVTLPAAVR